MTEQIKSAIKIEKEKANNDYEMASSFHDDNGVYLKYETQYRERAEYEERLAEWLEDYLYIKSAWSEVLQELEEKKDVYKLVPISSTAMGKAYTYDESTICMAIDIINQKLAEIEE